MAKLNSMAVSLLCLACGMSAMAQDDRQTGNDPLNAVVKLEVVSSSPDFVYPWKVNTQAADGSGVVIGDGRILTCAHCVANATHIRIRKQNEDSMYQGKVEFIDHDCDLALVKIDEPKFMKEVTPMELGETPSPQDNVLAVGFPIGGDSISFTKGIVSRIESICYAHSFLDLLGVQVDAAINPGNSGGPVLDMETFRIVGIAFQGNSSGESLGYMIPPDIIRHFFKDIEDGEVNGFSANPFYVSGLENDGARRFLKMKEEQTGVLITDIGTYPIGDNSVMVGDIILEVDGYKVANNGIIRLENNERRDMMFPLTMRQLGENVPVTVLRDGDIKKVLVPVLKTRPRLRQIIYDALPDYYIFGGYVFTTASVNLLAKYRSLPKFADDLASTRKFPDDEGVVITTVLADNATEGYFGIGASLVVSANGVKIRNLKHLIELIEGCEDEFIKLMINDNNKFDEPVYLEVRPLREATSRVLERYGIPNDRSADLRK